MCFRYIRRMYRIMPRRHSGVRAGGAKFFWVCESLALLLLWVNLKCASFSFCLFLRLSTLLDNPKLSIIQQLVVVHDMKNPSPKHLKRMLVLRSTIILEAFLLLYEDGLVLVVPSCKNTTSSVSKSKAADSNSMIYEPAGPYLYRLPSCYRPSIPYASSASSSQRLLNLPHVYTASSSWALFLVACFSAGISFRPTNKIGRDSSSVYRGQGNTTSGSPNRVYLYLSVYYLSILLSTAAVYLRSAVAYEHK